MFPASGTYSETYNALNMPGGIVPVTKVTSQDIADLKDYPDDKPLYVTAKKVSHSSSFLLWHCQSLLVYTVTTAVHSHYLCSRSPAHSPLAEHRAKIVGLLGHRPARRALTNHSPTT